MAGCHAVKVLSPEMTFLSDCAQALFIAEGNTSRHGNGECRGGTRGLRPVRVSHYVVAITREIRGALLSVFSGFDQGLFRIIDQAMTRAA